jgi:two-component system chemotaxis response regulator CheB
MSDIRVLIVDDSPTVRSLLKRGLDRAKGIEVIGMAADPYVARDMIVKDPPDVVTLDIEMPRMDGLTFLRKIMMHFPLPVVVVSTLTQKGSRKVVEALEAGAVDVVAKNMGRDHVNDLMIELVQKVRAAAQASVGRRGFGKKKPQPSAPRPVLALKPVGNQVVAIGSSTGGTEALAHLFKRLPANAPGMVIVQHLPPDFTAQMADRLDNLSAMNVREARDGDLIEPGVALVAPGDRHLLVRRQGTKLVAELRDGPRVSRHKPSVNVLFRSVAETVGAEAIGVILTGMGKDGAEGMLTMKEQGAYNIAQDEKSCVVYGMPRAAFELGATHEVASLDRMAERICRAVSRPVKV